jgi:hypothetical protein
MPKGIVTFEINFEGLGGFLSALSKAYGIEIVDVSPLLKVRGQLNLSHESQNFLLSVKVVNAEDELPRAFIVLDLNKEVVVSASGDLLTRKFKVTVTTKTKEALGRLTENVLRHFANPEGVRQPSE